MNFNRHCLINNNISIPKIVINLYIFYTLNPWLTKNCLFGSVKLNKNANPYKYKFSDYGLGFDSRSEFSFTEEA